MKTKRMLDWWPRLSESLWNIKLHLIGAGATFYIHEKKMARALTPHERRAVERAFEKFSQGFDELDKVFNGWSCRW